MTAQTPADVFTSVADYFAADPDRWDQGSYIGLGDCRCSLGAIAYALNPADRTGDPMDLSTGSNQLGVLARTAADFFAHYLIDYLDVPMCTTGDDEHQPMELDVTDTVAGWNDEQGRTPGQVVAAFRAAADEWNHRQAARVERAA